MHPHMVCKHHCSDIKRQIIVQCLFFSVDKKSRGIKDLGPEMIFETKNSQNGQPGCKTKKGQPKPDVKATSVLLPSPVKIHLRLPAWARH